MILSEIGERQIIESLRQKIKGSTKNLVGLIDDAAILDVGSNEYLVVTIDRIPFPYGLKCGIGGYKDLGKYFACTVIIDVIAKGAKPFAFLQALGLPSTMYIEDLEQLVDGVNQIANKYGIDIIGGDTKEKDDADLVGVCIGWTMRKKYFPRDAAKVGDVVAVTGPLGLFSAYMYLATTEEGAKISEKIRETIRIKYVSHIDIPYAVMERIRDLDSCNASADISDGLLGEVHRIAKYSNVGVRLYVDQIFVPDELRELSNMLGKHPYYFPLCVGGDLQIVLTINPKKWKVISDKLREENLKLYPIGEIIAKEGVYLSNSCDKEIVEPVEWEYFRNLSYKDLFRKVDRLLSNP